MHKRISECKNQDRLNASSEVYVVNFVNWNHEVSLKAYKQIELNNLVSTSTGH